MSEPVPAPFIVANPGSGTTLLRMMLDAHPDLAIPPETHFVPDLIERAREIRRASDRKPTGAELAAEIASDRRWADFHISQAELAKRMSGRRGEAGAKAAIRAFYELYAEWQGKARWGDKTPDYLRSIRRIGRTLPEAHFVHLVRDGRDVAVSRRRWRGRAGAKERPVEKWASQWSRWIATARKQSADVEHYIEVRYEDLVTDTEPTLAPRLRVHPARLPPGDARLPRAGRGAARGAGPLAAGLRRARASATPQTTARPSTPLTSAPPQEEKVQAWRREMTDEDRPGAFEAEAGELLAELGYPVGEAVARERRGGHEVVQPRAAGRGPLPALGAGRAGPRDVHPRPAQEANAARCRARWPRDDVWDQPGVTEGSSYDIPAGEYDAWVEANGIEVVFCDQNYQFDEIRRLRERGVRTVGRFVWEHFAAEHVEGAVARVRRRLLVHPRRAGRGTPGWGSRAPTSPGAVTPSWWRSAKAPPALAGRPGANRLPRRASSATESRSSR